MRAAHITKRISLVLLAAVMMVPLIASLPRQASAISGADFQAGNIIDDSTFYYPGFMDASDIQRFLSSKVPTCDTNGTQAYSGTTAGAYGTSKGYPPPYTCLKDYRQTTVAKPGDSACSGYAEVEQSAAEIIYGVAQSCGVNPAVLIVLLQKEQGLVTDDWPWSSQYNKATGYACPDTAPCNTQYAGYFNQVYSAARQFKLYGRNPGNYNYIAGRNNNIQYNPNAGCGSSAIFIQSQATAGLYNYTPYQPNQAALNNLYGSGDSCSSYGNRNFWRYYIDWFGATYFSPGKDADGDGILNKNDICKVTSGRGQFFGCPENDKNLSSSVSGDFNGDGYGDVMTASMFADGQTFNLWLFPGSSSGLQAPVFQRTLGPNNGGWYFTKSRMVATDTNHDGYSDLVIFHQGPSNEIVRHVMKGSAGGLQPSTEATVQWLRPSQGWLWSNLRIAGAGDFNGDTYGDVLAFSANPDGQAFNIYLFPGSSTGLQAPVFQRAQQFESFATMTWDFTRLKMASTDIDKDGDADLAVFSQGPNNEIQQYLFKGSTSGIQAPVTTSTNLTTSQGWNWNNIRVAGAGDFNGDTYNDVLIFSVYPDGQTFNIWSFPGSNTGLLAPVFQRTLGPNNGGWYFSKSRFATADVNKDNYGDLVIFHRGPGNEIVRHLLKGSSTGILASDETNVLWLGPAQGWLWSNLRVAGTSL